MRLTVLFFTTVYCYGHVLPIAGSNVHKSGLSENIGNSSLELLYHTGKLQPNGRNLVMSPVTIMTAMALLAEGASGNTRKQINNALRFSNNQDATRSEYRNIAQALQVKTESIELTKLNAILVDRKKLPLQDFLDTAKIHYQTDAISLNFEDGKNSADYVNNAFSNLTRGRIPKLVDSGVFRDSFMLLTSGLYFKGQWTVPFDSKSTTRQPFYDSNGGQIGEVDMMHNCYTYPFSNIKELQARVIELPYGKGDRLSMIIILPNQGVSLETMFSNFQNFPFNSILEELKQAKEKFSDDEVRCTIPRFKIESNLDMTEVLKTRMGIEDLFDQSKARLPHMARLPLYVSKVIHKAVIEVTEEGTTAAGASVVEIPNRAGAVSFLANRPFTYMIVDKVVNSMIFGGFYVQPSL